jgi:glycine/D-amino acid oxidase-like deaminating enzyme
MRRQESDTGFSFWESQTYFKQIDLLVIGSGIVGLNAAISYKEKYKTAKVLVLERGMLPSGASTKNAGFACFGSVSELISDIKQSGESLVWQTVEMRIKGLELLRKRLGDQQIDYREYGGYELFDNEEKFSDCTEHIDQLNKNLRFYVKEKQVYRIVPEKIKKFGFKGIKGLVYNQKEGQIDTGLMMSKLIELAYSKGIRILNNIEVKRLHDSGNAATILTSIGEIEARKVIVATNGFASELLKLKDVRPARAQVLITKPINDLKIKGTFHYDEGYYYFRNIGNRVLFGGGRNLDFKTETTTKLELNPKIHSRLDQLLSKVILPDTNFEIEQRWAGIMGVGTEKKPIIKTISPNIVCAVRMGGMGIAIGSLVGKLAVDELSL